MWTGLLQLKYLKYRSTKGSPLQFQLDGLHGQSSTSSINLPASIVDVTDETKMAIIKKISEQIGKNFTNLMNGLVIDGNEYTVKIRDVSEKKYSIEVKDEGNDKPILKHVFDYDEKKALVSAESFEFEMLKNLNSCIGFRIFDREPEIEQKSAEDKQDPSYNVDLQGFVDSHIINETFILYKKYKTLIILKNNLKKDAEYFKDWLFYKTDTKISTIIIPVKLLLLSEKDKNSYDFYKLERA